MSQAKIGSELPNTQLPLDDIVLRRRHQGGKNSKRYRAVLASIKELGVIEPLSAESMS
jgi:hypothetical protein